jgi:hypothetical protein
LLSDHAQSGGALLLILGPSLESQINNIDGAPLAQLLPGTQPRLQSRPASDRSAFWNPTAPTHAVYQELEYPAGEIAWQMMPIFKSWSFGKLAGAGREGGVQVLAELSNSPAPLLTLQDEGKGQIMTLLTPIPEFESTGRTLWNELWITDQFWWSFGILSGSLNALRGAGGQSINYPIGSPVSMPNEALLWPRKWDLYTPDAQRLPLEASDGLLAAGSHLTPGIYHLRGNMGAPVSRGFSVNVPADDTRLVRLTDSQLDELLGPGSYRLARQREEVESSVGQARYGRELFPLLMLFVAALFFAEQAMSSRFYQVPLKLKNRST